MIELVHARMRRQALRRSRFRSGAVAELILSRHAEGEAGEDEGAEDRPDPCAFDREQEVSPQVG
jgi:hypothetical protein